MASYSKDDFVVGSDLSDISDISDSELNDFSPTSDDSCSEDDGRQYCVCGEPSTTEMIASMTSCVPLCGGTKNAPG